MEYKINALSIYEYGKRTDKEGNPHQEDWLYPAHGDADNERDRLFILCDGMGGHEAGEVASRAVCEAMSGCIVEAMERGEEFSEGLLNDALAAAYDLLDERDTEVSQQKKMGTTMAMLMLHKRGYTIAHIGDSRVYHIRPTKGTKEDIVWRTEDHSLVNDLLKIGELTPEEAETYPHKNVITRAMQPHQERRQKADVHYGCDVRPGDYFYLCSDGMLEHMSDNNLCFNINENMTDEEKMERLVLLTKDNRDNHSAYLVHILGVEPLPENDAASLLPIVGGDSNSASDDGVETVSPEFDVSIADSAEESTTYDSPKDEDTLCAGGISEVQEPKKESGGEVVLVGGGLPSNQQPTVGRKNDKKRNVLLLLVCIAVALLALCAILFVSGGNGDEKSGARPAVEIGKGVATKNDGNLVEGESKGRGSDARESNSAD